MNEPIFTSKSDWNATMWNGAEHEYNKLGASEWNIAHVRNAINSYNSVPPKHHALSVELLDGVLSNLINTKKDFHDLQILYRETVQVQADVREALMKHDILRCLALLEDWKKGNRKWKTLNRKT